MIVLAAVMVSIGLALPASMAPAATPSAVDITQSHAQWLSRDTVVWKAQAPAADAFVLVSSQSGGIGTDGSAPADAIALRLAYDPAGLSPALLARFPNLAGFPTFHVVDPDRAKVTAALTGQLVDVEANAAGVVQAATGVQIPGVLDDVYGAAAKRLTFGPAFNRGLTTVRVWAPSAQSVRLRVYRNARTATYQIVAMQRDAATGAWAASGSGWNGEYYLFEVRVWQPTTQRIENNVVTDPYSLGLSTNSTRSLFVDLDDPALAPPGWSALRKPALPRPADISIYELHVRDFSVYDATVPAGDRGTYEAFTASDSNGMKHLRSLAQAGLTTVHLLPTFDIATIEERRSAQQTPQCDLSAFPPDSPAQQACVMALADQDAYNWGYDPLHYTTPEGSYATNPEGATRTRQYRDMVAALNHAGLRTVADVVYNHTDAAGEDPHSVLDQVVPGYYQRLDDNGAVFTSTCCPDTATEHTMMGKLVVDSVLTWAKEYKVDGFRFDLMGFQPKQNILDVRAALDRLTLAKDGVDGTKIYLYGEGWNFGEVADNARFVQASQTNMAGTGVGTFNDRLRDAVRGGGPFDSDMHIQGFGSGLWSDPNGDPINGTPAEQQARLLHLQDLIEVGLAGNLKSFSFLDSEGVRTTGAGVDYGGQPAGYTDRPTEAINYVDAHDNEALYDILTYKLPQPSTMADRVRMQALSLSVPFLSQGVPFVQAGTDILRSKSFDANSYNSGDWFNRIDWSYHDNGFGSGLPPQSSTGAKWPQAQPLLADPALKPNLTAILASKARFTDLLRIRDSSRLFRLGDAQQIQQKLTFSSAAPGVIVMRLNDTRGTAVDPRWANIFVVFNATATAQTITVPGVTGHPLRLHPVQANGSDPLVKTSTADSATGSLTVPGRTAAVFVEARA